MENELHPQLLTIIQGLDSPACDIAEADRLRLLSAGISSVAQLVDLVKSSTAEAALRVIGIWFLDKLPPAEPTLLALTSLLQDPAPALRRAAIESIGKLGQQSFVPLLIRILQTDPALEVRKMAAYALGLIGDPRALEALCTAVAGVDEPVPLRGMAAEALGNLGEVGAASCLCRALSEPSSEIQYWAAYALGELALSGPEAKKVRDALERLVANSSDRVKEQAQETLSRLERLERP